MESKITGEELREVNSLPPLSHGLTRRQRRWQTLITKGSLKTEDDRGQWQTAVRDDIHVNQRRHQRQRRRQRRQRRQLHRRRQRRQRRRRRRQREIQSLSGISVVLPTWCHLVPYGDIWCHILPYGAIWCTWCHMVPYGDIWCHMVPYGAIW